MNELSRPPNIRLPYPRPKCKPRPRAESAIKLTVRPGVEMAIAMEREACAELAYCEAVRWAYVGKPIDMAAASTIAKKIRERGT